MSNAVPADEANRRGTPGRRDETAEGYWRANLRLQLGLLAIWAVVGYVLSIFLAEPLNEITVYGFPIAFWFAQQGAIVVFVILIFVYAWRMDHVDHEFGVEEEELGWARRRLERRMQKELTGEAPAAEAELGEPTGEERREER
jgi:putative solute:sodium symporter small subunit